MLAQYPPAPPWALLWGYVLPFGVMVQIFARWYDGLPAAVCCNCCTQLLHTSAHIHTHTHRGLDLEILNHGESVISSYVLAPPPYMDHHQHWACTCDTGYDCERFIPLQCCCAGEASRTPSVKAWLWNSAPSSLFKLEKCFNFLF